ncbi:MAG: DUF2283 domain-containing protein [Bdellovibrionota bacterium]
MRIHFDEKTDALYLRLDEASRVLESEEVSPGVILDFDERDEVVGIEILRVRERFPKGNFKQIELDLS